MSQYICWIDNEDTYGLYLVVGSNYICYRITAFNLTTDVISNTANKYRQPESANKQEWFPQDYVMRNSKHRFTYYASDTMHKYPLKDIVRGLVAVGFDFEKADVLLMESYYVPPKPIPEEALKDDEAFDSFLSRTIKNIHEKMEDADFPDYDDSFPWKYEEGEFLEGFEKYLRGTYGEHYVQKEDGIQCFDAWMAMGDSWPTFRNTAIKYLWRYGQKDGFNKKDVYKAIHYVILMYYAAMKENEDE